MSPFFALLCLISGSQALLFKPIKTLNGTTLTDDVLNRTRAEIIRLHLDPLHLPNLNFKLANQSAEVTNQTIVGLSHVRRAGPVDVQINLLNTKFFSTFEWYNVSQDADVAIHVGNVSYPHGHIHQSCNNITSYQVFEFNYLTQSLTLDQYELSIGKCDWNVTGLGGQAEDFSATMDEVFDRTKAPFLKLWNVTFKLAVNAGLAAAKAALFG